MHKDLLQLYGFARTLRLRLWLSIGLKTFVTQDDACTTLTECLPPVFDVPLGNGASTFDSISTDLRMASRLSNTLSRPLSTLPKAIIDDELLGESVNRVHLKVYRFRDGLRWRSPAPDVAVEPASSLRSCGASQPALSDDVLARRCSWLCAKLSL